MYSGKEIYRIHCIIVSPERVNNRALYTLLNLTENELEMY